MKTEEIRALFAYNAWATGRILAAADGLSAADYEAIVPGISHGSLRGTLIHLLGAEEIWRRRCLEGVSPTTLLGVADAPTLAALRDRWEAGQAAWRAGLATLTDDALAAPLAYRTTRGAPMEDTLWQVLVHVVNHGTQHRAEAAVVLTAFGRSPGDVDYIIYLRQGTA